jgi:hypothetical protein
VRGSRTREAGNRDEVEGVAANTLNSFRNEARLLAKAFGVGFIDWLGLFWLIDQHHHARELPRAISLLSEDPEDFPLQHFLAAVF